jgi:hypothetical protein
MYKRYHLIGVLLISVLAVRGYQIPALYLGFSNILDGGPVRPKPGFYWQEYMQYYTAHKFLDNEGNPSLGVPSPHFKTLNILSQLVYQCNYVSAMKGMPGFSFGLPTVFFASITPNTLGLESSGGGFGTFGCGVFNQFLPIMHKERPLFIHRIEFDIYVPLGKNKLPKKNINPGNAYFSCSLYWAATLYLTQKWSLSWRLYYEWNAKNEKIDFRLGDAIYANYSLAYEVYPNVHFGLVGYGLKQLHNNRSNGAIVPHSKQRILAAGPGVLYFYTEDIVLLSYLYVEGAARNCAEGINFIARIVMHF